MIRPKAFILVGHSNWGKSSTLRELLPSAGRRRAWTDRIGGKWIFVKRMSNDDDPEDLLNFVKTVDQTEKTLIIIAFCPNFSEASKNAGLILQILQKKYDLYFHALEQKWDGTDSIDEKDIRKLETYGKVSIYSERSDYHKRAKAFRQFIEKHI